MTTRHGAAAAPAPGRTTVVAAVAAIFVVAVVLRFWKLRWGLRDGMAFTDELQMWPSYLGAFVPLRAASFLRADTPAAMLYPSLYGFLAGGATAALHALGLVPAPRADVFPALYVARLVAASASLANVALVGLLALRAATPRAALLAAALMAVVPLEAMQTHYASVDPLLGACTTLALLLACEVARSGSAWAALAAGAAAGLAFSAKYTGLVTLGACGWAMLEVCARGRSVRPLLRLVPATVAGFALLVFLACPPCVLQSDLMLRAMAGLSNISSASYLAFWNVQLVPTLGWYGRPYVYQLVAGMPFGFGWPLYLASVCGVVRALARRDVTDRVLLVTLAAYFLSVGMSFVLEATRYYVPMVPILVVLTARMLDELRAPWLGRAVFAGVWLYTAAFTSSQVKRYSFAQQMAVAGWVKQNVPAPAPGAARIRVAYPQGLDAYYGLRQPIIWAGMTPVATPAGHWLDDRPEAFVVPEVTALRWRRDVPGGPDAQALALLESGAAGYRPVQTFRSGYLQSGFYTWLDPAFAGDYAQGEIGFTIYLRPDLAGAS